MHSLLLLTCMAHGRTCVCRRRFPMVASQMCPVKDSPSVASGCPVAPATAANGTASLTSATASGCGAGGGGGSSSNTAGAPVASRCPVQRRGVDAGAGADVLNPANAMPVTPNQQPAPGQRAPLSTHRVTSTIPSAERTEPRWVYPSEQMFFNAMRRKGYDPREEEMGMVVAIHNSVNERTWVQVLEYEGTLYPECVDTLQLVRFVGKPDEPTLKARARALTGYAKPFDRHDWVLSRCGKEVTYLIDFYNGTPTPLKPVAMHIDARPAADDLQSAWDRARMPFVRFWRSVRPQQAAAAATAAAAYPAGGAAASSKAN